VDLHISTARAAADSPKRDNVFEPFIQCLFKEGATRYGRHVHAC
jgi:hypothetical protein